MGCKTETKYIGEREFNVTQWSAEKAFLNQIKLAKIFAGSISTIAGALASLEKEESSDSDKIEKGANAFGKGLEQLFLSSNPEEIVAFMKECIIGVACDGTKITNGTFDSTFDADSLSEIYQVFFFVLKVNYSNFIPGQLVDKVQHLASLSTGFPN